jgi:hypothetical protein
VRIDIDFDEKELKDLIECLEGEIATTETTLESFSLRDSLRDAGELRAHAKQRIARLTNLKIRLLLKQE